MTDIDQQTEQGTTESKSEIRNPDKVYELFKQTQAELKEAQKTLKNLGGVTPEEIQQLRSDLDARKQAEKEAEEKRLEAEGQYKALYHQRLGEVEAKYQRELEKLQKQLKALTDERETLNNELTTTKGTLTETRAYSKAFDAYLASGGRKGEAGEDPDSAFSLLWAKHGKDLMQILSDEPPTDEKGNAIKLSDYYEKLKTKASTKYLFEGIQPVGNSVEASKTPTSGTDKPKVISRNDLLNLKKLGIKPQDIIDGKVLVQ